MLRCDEDILLALDEHLRLGEAGIAAFEKVDDKGWAIVQTGFRDAASRLLDEGYVERHPNKRRKRWYRISERGQEYLRQIRYDRTNEGEEILPPWMTEAIAAYRRRARGGGDEDDAQKVRRLLEYEAGESFKVLARQMAVDGYTYIPEPGRVAEKFIVTFFGLYDGRLRLYKYRTRGIVTAWREEDYYLPDYEALDAGFETSPTPRSMLREIPI